MKETSFIVLLLLSSTFGSVIFKRSLEETPNIDIDIQSLYYINNLQYIFDVKSFNPPPRSDINPQDIFGARSTNPPPKIDRTFEDIRASKARSLYVPPPRLDRTVEDIRASKARSTFIPRPRLDRTFEDIRASKAKSAFILRPRLDRTVEDVRASKAKSMYILRPRLDRTTEDIRASEAKALSNQKQLDVKVQDPIVIAKRSLEHPEKPEKNLQQFFDSYNSSPRLDKNNQNIYTSKSENPSPRLDRTVEDISASKARSTFVLRPRIDRTTEDIRASKARYAYIPRPRLDRTIEDIRASKSRSVYSIRPRLDRTVEDIQKSETEYLKQVEKENVLAASKTPTCTKYKFRTTPNQGSYSEARTMCLTLGGDLLSKNIGPSGAQYHAVLRKLIEDHTAHYWIGLTDIENDGKFHLLDGSSYDPSDMTQQALYYWYPGQPNLDVDDRCGQIWFQKDTLAYGLGDYYCDHNVLNDVQIKGICEICESWTL